MANLIGKNVLIVDEVDDTRTTLEYAVRELMKDVEEARRRSGRTDEESKTRFSIFVLHVGILCYTLHAHIDGSQNKDKSKRGNLPNELLDDNRYLAAVTVPDVWICYPWEAS